MGVHIVLDFYGVDPKLISDVNLAKAILDEAIKKSGIKTLKSFFHKFELYGGFSGIYLLETSHVSIHTWPEIKYAAIDIFVCDKSEKAFKFFEIIKEKFKPKKIDKKVIKRDYYERSPLYTNADAQ